MSARHPARLLRLYPAAWRARYGDELAALIMDSSPGRRVPWRTRADVAAGAGRERLRAAGLSGTAPPHAQARGGSLAVLVAWTLFVVAGAGVQKFSEHWQAATPVADRAAPAAAFAALVAGAVAAGAAVVAGAMVAVPAVRTFAREGGWTRVRGRLLAAAVLTSAGMVATAGLVAWAHTLTARQRDGHDAAYAAGFLVWGVLVAAGLLAWVAVAVAIARRLRWPPAALRAEVWLAVATTAGMAVTTAATAAWWCALARTAPWFLAGRPVGHPAPVLAPQLALSAAAMAAATLAAVAGSWRALRGLTGMRPAPGAAASG